MGNGNGKLPRGNQARLMALVERSAPARDRPRLPDDIEAQLYEVDIRSAACYASMEDLADQLDDLAEQIDNGNGIVAGELICDDSLAAKIDGLKQQIHSDVEQ